MVTGRVLLVSLTNIFNHLGRYSGGSEAPDPHYLAIALAFGGWLTGREGMASLGRQASYGGVSRQQAAWQYIIAAPL